MDIVSITSLSVICIYHTAIWMRRLLLEVWRLSISRPVLRRASILENGFECVFSKASRRVVGRWFAPLISQSAVLNVWDMMKAFWLLVECLSLSWWHRTLSSYHSVEEVLAGLLLVVCRGGFFFFPEQLARVEWCNWFPRLFSCVRGKRCSLAAWVKVAEWRKAIEGRRGLHISSDGKIIRALLICRNRDGLL